MIGCYGHVWSMPRKFAQHAPSSFAQDRRCRTATLCPQHGTVAAFGSNQPITSSAFLFFRANGLELRHRWRQLGFLGVMMSWNADWQSTM